MPELPEVETLVRQLRPVLTGRRIHGVHLTHDDILEGVTRRTLHRGLIGATITGIDRRAKHALIHTDRWILAIQPGMSGTLMHHLGRMTTALRQYAVLQCELDDKSTLIYRDVRRIGTIRWLDQDGWEQYASRLGPEPLDPAFTAEQFADRMAISESAIKKVLMNQRHVVGVGNIYANEALHAARINPRTPANKVSRRKLLALHGEMQRILQAAITSGGSTIRDYVSSAGEGGRFQQSLNVYGRGGQPCRTCGAVLATTHAIDKRATVFCRRCQR